MKGNVVRSLLLLGLCLAFPVARAQAQVTNMTDVKTWRIWEGVFRTTQAYVNPSYDVQLKVTFTPPAGSGLSQVVAYGFWDGKESGTTHVFKVRTALPPAPGVSPWIWTWTQSCTGGGCNTDPVLNPSSPTPFSVSVTPSAGGHALFNPGFLKVHSSGRYLVHDNGTPFYWLGDTAWNASVRAANAPSGGTAVEWENYVNARKAKGFTVIQIALPVDYMDNRKDGVQPQDVNGQTPFTQLTGTGRTCTTELPNQCTQWNPAYWSNFEQKVRYANAQGLVVLVVGLAERIHEKNTVGEPNYPNNSDLQVYARNVVTRLGGHFVVYSPGFDRMPGGSGCTTAPGDMTCRIQTVGLQIQTTSTRHLVTNHFAGSMDVTLMAPFINESWYDFQLYQSGQGCNATSEANQLNLVTNRPRTMALYLYDLTTTGGAHKPVVNGEAIYDGSKCASGWTSNFTAYRARQAGYLSMTSGAVGYTLGVIGVYDWGLNGIVSPSTGWGRPSGTQMQILCRAFRGLPAWEQLVPDHNLIVNKIDPSTGLPWTDPLTMTVARDSGNQFAVAYLPNNAAIKIDATNFVSFDTWTKEWVDPRTGTAYPATCVRQGISLTYKCDIPTGVTIPAGETGDWFLRLSGLPFLSTTATCG